MKQKEEVSKATSPKNNTLALCVFYFFQKTKNIHFACVLYIFSYFVAFGLIIAYFDWNHKIFVVSNVSFYQFDEFYINFFQKSA